MTRRQWLADAFEAQRPHLRAVAYRMLGSVTEADDAVQEAWLRLDRSDPGGTEDLRGWLTVVVGRICLDMLRTRKSRREHYPGTWLPEPLVTEPTDQPEHQAVMADSVGLALLVVLETLTPAERLAFVLHDVFAVPFDQVATVIDRSPEAARQLASRARRRIQADAPKPDADVAVQRRVVDAFLAAARAGDFEGLLAVLDPDVVFRSDAGGAVPVLNRPPIVGAEAVAREALVFRGGVGQAQPAIVNGGPGFIIQRPGRPLLVAAFTVAGGRIAAIDVVANPEKTRGVFDPDRQSFSGNE